MSYQRERGVQFGPGQTGLVGTVGYALFNSDGTPNGARTTAGITERPAGSGTYAALVTFPSGFLGELRWDTGGGSPKYASEFVSPQDGEYLDVAVSSTKVVSLPSGIVVTNPVSQNGSVYVSVLQITQGVDYKSADSRALVFTDTAGLWPTLNTTVTLTLALPSGNKLQFSGTVLNGAGSNKQVQIELTAAQTAGIPLTPATPYLLTATLGNGDVVPLWKGNAVVTVN